MCRNPTVCTSGPVPIICQLCGVSVDIVYTQTPNNISSRIKEESRQVNYMMTASSGGRRMFIDKGLKSHIPHAWLARCSSWPNKHGAIYRFFCRNQFLLEDILHQA
jgi:hypothetical protein